MLLALLISLLPAAAWAEDYSGPWRTSLDSVDSCWTEGVSILLQFQYFPSDLFIISPLVLEF